MKTIPQLDAMLNNMGSNVTYHREELGIPCPCRTPEGFRDQSFHDDLQAAWNVISNDISGTQQTPPGVLDPNHFYQWFLVSASNTYALGTPVEIWEEDADPLALPYLETLHSIRRPAFAGLNRAWLLRKVDGGPYQFLSAIDFVPIDYQDFNPFDYAQPTPGTLYATCNEEGILAAVTSATVKASVQPATIGLRGRAAERANALLGEIQRDDHFGIFPVTWGGVTLDFSAFSDSGDDYVVYDNRRFLVVAADKIPDVDGDPNHHWEVGLRLIKTERPA